MLGFMIYGMAAGFFLLIAVYGGAHLYAGTGSKSQKVTVRLITNCGGRNIGHWLYDEHHIDQPAYIRRQENT